MLLGYVSINNLFSPLRYPSAVCDCTDEAQTFFKAEMDKKTVITKAVVNCAFWHFNRALA
jgi:hypothetical protein